MTNRVDVSFEGEVVDLISYSAKLNQNEFSDELKEAIAERLYFTEKKMLGYKVLLEHPVTGERVAVEM